jgi:hypothetical protein
MTSSGHGSTIRRIFFEPTTAAVQDRPAVARCPHCGATVTTATPPGEIEQPDPARAVAGLPSNKIRDPRVVRASRKSHASLFNEPGDAVLGERRRLSTPQLSAGWSRRLCAS